MFSIFKKRSQPGGMPPDWSFLEVDMHSHLIPGIDDGAQSMEESMQLIRQLKEAGFRKLITTPHINEDFFPNTPERILQQFSLLKERLATERIDIVLEVAAEYMIDDSFMSLLLHPKPLLSVADQYVLIEMGFIQEHPLLEQAVFQLLSRGYIPVLAHPERYLYYHDVALNRLKELKEKGCLLQLNIIALSGYYGAEAQSLAQRLLSEKMYDFGGSDVHHERHVQALLHPVKYISRLKDLSESLLNKTL